MYFRLTAAEGETVVVEVKPDTSTAIRNVQEVRARAVAIRYFNRCWPWLVREGVVQRVACQGEASVPFGTRTYGPMGEPWYASNARRVRREPTTVGHVDEDEDRLDFPR